MHASLKEYPEKYSWWLNELESLGLAVKKANDLNDIRGQQTTKLAIMKKPKKT